MTQKMHSPTPDSPPLWVEAMAVAHLKKRVATLRTRLKIPRVAAPLRQVKADWMRAYCTLIFNAAVTCPDMLAPSEKKALLPINDCLYRGRLKYGSLHDDVERYIDRQAHLHTLGEMRKRVLAEPVAEHILRVELMQKYELGRWLWLIKELRQDYLAGAAMDLNLAGPRCSEDTISFDIKKVPFIMNDDARHQPLTDGTGTGWTDTTNAITQLQDKLEVANKAVVDLTARLEVVERDARCVKQTPSLHEILNQDVWVDHEGHTLHRTSMDGASLITDMIQEYLERQGYARVGDVPEDAVSDRYLEHRLGQVVDDLTKQMHVRVDGRVAKMQESKDSRSDQVDSRLTTLEDESGRLREVLDKVAQRIFHGRLHDEDLVFKPRLPHPTNNIS